MGNGRAHSAHGLHLQAKVGHGMPTAIVGMVAARHSLSCAGMQGQPPSPLASFGQPADYAVVTRFSNNLWLKLRNIPLMAKISQISGSGRSYGPSRSTSF